MGRSSINKDEGNAEYGQLDLFGEYSFDGNITESISEFKKFPFKRMPYSSRNWGHPLHFLCSYQSKMKPSMAHFLVKYFTRPEEVVLDPFSGVGTIPFEACSQGRKGIGLDINPIAYHNTRAKVRPPSISHVLKQINELSDYLENTPVRKEIMETADAFIKRFYHEKTLLEILGAKQYFLDRRQEDGKLSFMVSSVLHILHGNRPYALSRRSHGLTPLAPTGKFVYKSLISSLTDKAHRALSRPLPSDFVRGESYLGSVIDIPLKDGSVNSIITSPPFMESTRFFANNRIRLWFCGWEYKDQTENEKLFVDYIQKKNKEVYIPIFEEFYRVLKPDAVSVLHLGVTENINMAKTIRPMAEETGFKIVDIIYEDSSKVEHHGMTDQGVTKKHAFLVMQKR